MQQPYNEKKYLKTLDKEEREKLFDKIKQTFLEYSIEITNINNGIRAYSLGEFYLPMFYNAFISSFLDKYFDNNDQEKMINDAREIMKNVIENENTILHIDEIKEKTHEYAKVLANEIKRKIFAHYISKTSSEMIYVDELNFMYILEISRTEKKLVYKRANQRLLKIIKEFDLNVCSYKDVHKIAKKYREIEKNDFTFINRKKNKRLSGNARYVDLRLLFLDAEYFPTSKQIYKYIKDVTKGFEYSYIVFPFFIKGNSKIFKSRNYGHKSFYIEYSSYYDGIIKTLYDLNENQKIKILIPNLMDVSDYIFLSATIKHFFNREGKSIDTGIIIDEYEILNDLEMGRLKVDFAEINLDLINENNNMNKTITYDNFKELLMQNFRELHSFLRSENIEHFVSSTDCLDEQIVEKLFIMGFKVFLYNSKNDSKVINSINNYMGRRDKYRKK